MDATAESSGRRAGFGPVEEGRRIDAIDAARGLALLGIFCVNIHFFAAPFGDFLELEARPGSGPADIGAYYFVKFFCESKCYPLFSALFGAGLVIQMQRARAAGRRFVPLYLRRLAVLMVMGLCHALLMWYGDILFIYSIAGLVLLACHRMSARAMAITGAVIISISAVGGAAFSTLLMSGAPAQTTAQPTAPEEGDSKPAVTSAPAPPFERLMEGFRSGAVFEEAGKRGVAPMQTSLWLEAETDAFKHGPYAHAVVIRAINYGTMLVFVLAGFGWSVVAMFFFGAAMMKAGVFRAERLAFHKRMVVLAVAVAVPVSIICPLLLAEIGPKPWVILVTSLAQPICGPLQALGYISAVRLLVASGRLRALTGVLAAMGRMALTNYLLQTLAATAVFYHFGLGLFGEVGYAARLGIVAVIYLCQAAFSVLWLRRFQFGPMEWFWRTLTYLAPQPLLRRLV